MMNNEKMFAKAFEEIDFLKRKIATLERPTGDTPAFAEPFNAKLFELESTISDNQVVPANSYVNVSTTIKAATANGSPINWVYIDNDGKITFDPTLQSAPSWGIFRVSAHVNIYFPIGSGSSSSGSGGAEGFAETEFSYARLRFVTGMPYTPTEVEIPAWGSIWYLNGVSASSSGGSSAVSSGSSSSDICDIQSGDLWLTLRISNIFLHHRFDAGQSGCTTMKETKSKT